jgi:hypothetical protein
MASCYILLILFDVPILYRVSHIIIATLYMVIIFRLSSGAQGDVGDTQSVMSMDKKGL